MGLTMCWDYLADTRIQKVKNPQTRALVSESGLWFRYGINGKLSRAKIAHVVKHTCLSGCWNASVLGNHQGHDALPLRKQLSVTLLCPSLIKGRWNTLLKSHLIITQHFFSPLKFKSQKPILQFPFGQGTFWLLQEIYQILPLCCSMSRLRIMWCLCLTMTHL